MKIILEYKTCRRKGEEKVNFLLEIILTLGIATALVIIINFQAIIFNYTYEYSAITLFVLALSFYLSQKLIGRVRRK